MTLLPKRPWLEKFLGGLIGKAVAYLVFLLG